MNKLIVIASKGTRQGVLPCLHSARGILFVGGRDVCLVLFFFHSPSPAPPPPSVLSNSTPQRACFYEEFFFVNSLSLFLTEGRENDCVVCAQTVQLEPCHTPTRRKDCKGSERTPCSLYHTAATAAVLCAGVCVCVRIVVSLLAVLPTDFVVTRTVEPFRLRLAAGTKGVTLLRCPRRRRRERGCRRETAGLSPPSPPPPLLLFLCQEQPPTNVGVECSVYLRGRESGMGHSWRAPAKLCRTSSRKLTVCPCQVFCRRTCKIAICCFHWVVLFFCLPLPFPFLPSPSL